MPIIQQSTYGKPPRLQWNGHLQTIFPSLFRTIKNFSYERERLELDDGDFLDIDWVDKGSKNLVVLTHGLEGDSYRHYVKGPAKYFAQNDWDVLAWNCRSCSGEMNRTARLYHHGDIEDIGAVIDHALQRKNYETLVLIGFSMGGAISLNYVGKQKNKVPEEIKGIIAFSTPCDLKEGAEILNAPSNFFYKDRFFRKLKEKIIIKEQQFPGLVDLGNFKKIKVWEDFDNYFSAPLNGYQDAQDFYNNSSAKNFMQDIHIPILLVNAMNDPILTPGCSPHFLAEKKSNIFIENPKEGGHVGFMVRNNEFAWSEIRALEFVEEVVLK